MGKRTTSRRLLFSDSSYGIARFVVGKGEGGGGGGRLIAGGGRASFGGGGKEGEVKVNRINLRPVLQTNSAKEREKKVE